MHRPTVAFVRGAALNPFETQVFGALRGHDVRAIGQDPANYEVGLVPVPVTLLRPMVPKRAASIAGRLGLSGLARLPERLRGLENALDGADIVHAAETFIPFSQQAAEIAGRSGAKLVLTCWENIPFLYDDNSKVSHCKRQLRDAAALFIAVTEPAKQALVAEGVSPERIHVVPSAIDSERFVPGHDPRFLRSRLGLGERTRIVLFVGRMIREKGVTELVQAFSQLKDQPDAHLVLVGNGPETERVRVAAGALDVAERVHLLPGQSYTDIPAVFRSADVVVVPSLATPYWQEQFGYVLVEAMASGCSVVTTRSGSIPDVVGDGALLVDDYDVDQLSSAIATLLSNRDEADRLGSAGRARVLQRYSTTAVAPLLAAAYEAALAGR